MLAGSFITDICYIMKTSSIIKFFFLISICLTVFNNSLVAQTLPVNIFQQKLKKEKGILIDVRSSDEFNAQKIANAINIYVNDSLFIKEINKLERNRSYFLYCGIGKRSAKAMQIMKDNGFTKVYDLEKGLGEWKAKGLPTEKQKN